jgi:hypothetical protein
VIRRGPRFERVLVAAELAAAGVLVVVASAAPRRLESVAGAADSPDTLAESVAEASPERAAPPERLADTGLYSDFAAREIAPGILEFSPQYPLWTDGATKRRWIQLPAGTFVDASDPAAWVFPAGTKLWKQFSFGRAVETRLIELGRDGKWSFATYVWSEDGSDARLAPARGLPHAAESSPGVPYDIPGRADCLVCHTGGTPPVLGFSALQLSSDRDPNAPHAEVAPGAENVDLAFLVERGLVRNLPEELIERPPRIEAASPTERAALGYLHANCGMCHGRGGSLAVLGFDLDVGPDGKSQAVSSGLGLASRAKWNDGASLRIAGGDPAASVLVKRMSTRDPLVQMPPLGTHAVDAEALALITEWIRSDLSSPRSPEVCDSRRNP